MDSIIASGYLKKMSTSDKIARHLPQDMSVNDLTIHYKKSIIPLTEKEVAIVARLKRELKDLLRNKWPNALRVEYSCVKCLNIENEFPHTHGSTIFLPQRLFEDHYSFERLLKTFAHEFVHVYQRTHPIQTHGLINLWGYTPVVQREQLSTAFNMRLNPDLNDVVYQDQNGNIEFITYKSDSPSSLTDCVNVSVRLTQTDVVTSALDSKNEHPFERMAYTIADVLMSDQHDVICEKWMKNL